MATHPMAIISIAQRLARELVDLEREIDAGEYSAAVKGNLIYAANSLQDTINHMKAANILCAAQRLQETKMAVNYTHCIAWKVQQINTLLGTPQKPWKTDADGKHSVAVGCIFIDNANGGYSVRRMMESGGEQTVVAHGYYSKREILLQLEGFYQGLVCARERQAAQVS